MKNEFLGIISNHQSRQSLSALNFSIRFYKFKNQNQAGNYVHIIELSIT